MSEQRRTGNILGEYKGLQVPGFDRTITDEDVMESLRRLQAQVAVLAGTAAVDPVSQPAPAKVKPAARKAAKKAAPVKKPAAKKAPAKKVPAKKVPAKKAAARTTSRARDR